MSSKETKVDYFVNASNDGGLTLISKDSKTETESYTSVDAAIEMKIFAECKYMVLGGVCFTSAVLLSIWGMKELVQDFDHGDLEGAVEGVQSVVLGGLLMRAFANFAHLGSRVRAQAASLRESQNPRGLV